MSLKFTVDGERLCMWNTQKKVKKWSHNELISPLTQIKIKQNHQHTQLKNINDEV